jgi:hypothetical protein
MTLGEILDALEMQELRLRHVTHTPVVVKHPGMYHAFRVVDVKVNADTGAVVLEIAG